MVNPGKIYSIQPKNVIIVLLTKFLVYLSKEFVWCNRRLFRYDLFGSKKYFSYPQPNFGWFNQIFFGSTKNLDLFEKFYFLDQVQFFLGLGTFRKVFWLILLIQPNFDWFNEIFFGSTKNLDLFEKFYFLDQVQFFLGLGTFRKVFWLILLIQTNILVNSTKFLLV